MLKVLFLCTGNSCRSQMAEGWAKALKSAEVEAYSAGVEPKGLHPLAVKVMAEAGVDISEQRSKHVRTLKDIPFDYVVTVCDNARESCPLFPLKTKIIHAGFEDPAAAKGSEDEVLSVFRRVRDEMRDFVQGLPQKLNPGSST
ncbi:MAG TPA: arsenate reductase [Elusimicrobia bacterium]|nr:arsenate reductase [Elusimicrobiota bacterium]HBT62899.1 arsenate reductase [Elusimicrobiota bacterium]